MTCNGSDGATLTALLAPRRNRFYYGKLLDVAQMLTEQHYGMSEFAQLNRLDLGAGVICGLEVTNPAGTSGIDISAGLALDGWGRRIVVPEDYSIAHLGLTDQCGTPLTPAPSLPQEIVIGLCYRQCQTDFAPTLVSDPACGGCECCEGGTWLESFAVTVTRGRAEEPSVPCLPDVSTWLRQGRVHRALDVLSAACPMPPSNPCVPLANVAVNKDGTLTVDSATPRVVAPTNRDLLALIACLSQFIVQRSTVFAITGAAISMSDPNNPTATRFFPLSIPVSQPDVSAQQAPPAPQGWGVEVRFVNGAPDLPVPADAIAVQAGTDPGAPAVKGSVQWDRDNQTLIWGTQARLQAGTYQVTVFGSGTAAVTSWGVPLAGQATPDWPTGNGTIGNNFVFTFTAS